MKYYYDIKLNFNDYPIHYYEWSSSDDIDHLLKIKVIKVNCVDGVINYDVSVNLDDDKYILCDGVNSIGIEVINSRVVYLSYLSYKDDNSICDMVKNMEIYDLVITKYSDRVRSNLLRVDEVIKIDLLNLINNNDDFVKYIYYDLVGKIDDIDLCKKYLINDIMNNFNNKYFSLYNKLRKMI